MLGEERIQPEPKGSAGAGDDWGEVGPAKGSDFSGVTLVPVSDLINMIIFTIVMILVNIVNMVMMMMVRI